MKIWSCRNWSSWLNCIYHIHNLLQALVIYFVILPLCYPTGHALAIESSIVVLCLGLVQVTNKVAVIFLNAKILEFYWNATDVIYASLRKCRQLLRVFFITRSNVFKFRVRLIFLYNHFTRLLGRWHIVGVLSLMDARNRLVLQLWLRKVNDHQLGWRSVLSRDFAAAFVYVEWESGLLREVGAVGVCYP